MTNKAFTGTEYLNLALPKPLSQIKLKSFINNQKKIYWYSLADLSFGYDPYLVFVHSLVSSVASIQFVNCENGDLIGDRYENIDLSDLRNFHSTSPSTSLDEINDSPDDRIIFMMINPRFLVGKMREDAIASNAVMINGEGKWPNTATAEHIASLLDQLVVVRGHFARFLDDINSGRKISPAMIEFYRNRSR